VPAVRPDGVRALGTAARGLVLAGVHDLEGVDVAVGLVGVAVAAVVAAVTQVALGAVRLDLGVGLAGRLLLGDPGVQAVADDVPHARAVALAAGVVAVTGLVVRDLDPVGDLALDRVAAGGLLLEVRLDRLGVLALAEVQVLEVLPVVVRLPGGGVVLLAVRLGDLVVQRAGRAAVAAVDLVAELDQDREDLVGLLAAELDVLGVALLALEADDLGAVTVLHGVLAGDDLLQRLLALRGLGLGERALEVVLDVGLLRRVLPVHGGRPVGPIGRVGLGQGERRAGGGGRRDGHAYRGRSERPWSRGHLRDPLPRACARQGGSGNGCSPRTRDQRV